jgi:hypothetical protein
MKSVVVLGLIGILIGFHMTKTVLPPHRSRVGLRATSPYKQETDPLTLPGEQASQWVNRQGVPMFLRLWTELAEYNQLPSATHT